MVVGRLPKERLRILQRSRCHTLAVEKLLNGELASDPGSRPPLWFPRPLLFGTPPDFSIKRDEPQCELLTDMPISRMYQRYRQQLPSAHNLRICASKCLLGPRVETQGLASHATALLSDMAATAAQALVTACATLAHSPRNTATRQGSAASVKTTGAIDFPTRACLFRILSCRPWRCLLAARQRAKRAKAHRMTLQTTETT